MKRIVTAAACALIAAGAASAQEGQVMRMGDTALTCQEIIAAASEQTGILGGSPEGGLMTSEYAVNTATALAQHGAMMSGAARAVPGLGAVGGMMGRAAQRQREQEEARRAVAEKRWYFLNGLYGGRNCDTILRQEAQAAAAAAPAPEAAPEPEPAVEAEEG
ncbi:hypothetical protein F1654_06810 [Alkalicaulis satelles]|uniref:Uncharacterized protein n=1 Tax=Alkalicaulis satelles TaxID=2609175 RepID=A0A5M6ZGS2_9PROT|nr:hypothetical protein [Alkalicaulis satelles]KAA5803510.1 hypothetical protein F1654_06810 [Alkalicaulis satelles]